MHSFTFIDLFAGIGGIRLGVELASKGDAQCVFTSEWNKYAARTYKANFGEGDFYEGDITKLDAELIPDHDLLLAGFPCQPFSIAGVSKNNSLGRSHGFAHATQGTLFFDVARIIATKRPAAFMLENVKNLVSHDKGRTFEVIKRTLVDELGYHIHYKVIDALRYLPQHRERIIIVGFREDNDFTWDKLQEPVPNLCMRSILHPEDGTETADAIYTQGPHAVVNPKYILKEGTWAFLQHHAAKHSAKGNGFGYGLVTPDMTSRTLSARYYKDGSEILVSRGDGKRPRRLTPRECARLMGFPDDFKILVSDTQAYKQFGNSVAVPVIRAVASLMIPYIEHDPILVPQYLPKD